MHGFCRLDNAAYNLKYQFKPHMTYWKLIIINMSIQNVSTILLNSQVEEII